MSEEKSTLTKGEIEWLQKWMKAITEKQDHQYKILDKINDKLGFFVFIVIVAIVINIISFIISLISI